MTRCNVSWAVELARALGALPEAQNQVTGCTPLSSGCTNCYARAFAGRWVGVEGHAYEKGFAVQLHPERLEWPLHWKKPRVVFVDSMGDLFHADVPEGFIASSFNVMGLCPQHLFIILTKRPERMKALAPDPPLPNVWLGVSVEDQVTADKRVPLLQETPAALRLISAEPLLGEVTLSLSGVSWTLCGGETGEKHRMVTVDAVMGIKNQCVAAKVPFFFKGWPGRYPDGPHRLEGREWRELPNVPPFTLRKYEP
jgi:protein gp37